MKYYDKLNEPVIIKNTDFRKCIIFVSFPITDYRREDLMILRNIAFDRSMKYDTDKKIYEVNINNYCLTYKGGVSFLGDVPFLEFMLSFPSFDSLNKDVFEDNLKFIKEIIYNPYLEDGAFPKDVIDDIISITKNNIKRGFKDSMWYYPYRSDSLVDEDNYLCNPVVDNPSLLDDVTPTGLYNLYKKIVSNPPLVFMIGNVNEDEARERIKEVLLDNKVSKVRFEEKYNHFAVNIPEECMIKEEKAGFKTSYVSYSYKVRNMSSERDMVLLKIVRNLLDSGPSKILFNTLRVENDLVYRCGANSNGVFGLLVIDAFTSARDISKVEECYREVMEKISDTLYIEEKFPLILEKARLNEELEKENLTDILMNEVDRSLEYKTESFYEFMKDISSSEIKKFIDDRLVLVSKYVGVGEICE